MTDIDPASVGCLRVRMSRFANHVRNGRRLAMVVRGTVAIEGDTVTLETRDPEVIEVLLEIFTGRPNVEIEVEEAPGGP